MKITEITVECGMTMPHSRYQYSSVRESVSATAKLEEGEMPGKATKKLQDFLLKMVTDRIQKRMEEPL